MGIVERAPRKHRAAIAKPAEPNSNIIHIVSVAAMEATMAPVSDGRPLLNMASAYVRDQQAKLTEAQGEIDLIDGVEARAEDAHRADIERADIDRDAAIARIEQSHREAVEGKVKVRNAERESRARLRAEYAEIATRCKAALGLSDGAEGQGQ
jgi:hypothetical protein